MKGSKHGGARCKRGKRLGIVVSANGGGGLAGGSMQNSGKAGGFCRGVRIVVSGFLQMGKGVGKSVLRLFIADAEGVPDGHGRIFCFLLERH